MGKGTHFLGQPILNQLLNYFNKQNILQMSRENGGERYVKTFNAWCQQWHQGFFTQKKRGVKIMVVTSLLIEIKDNRCN